MAEPIDWLPDGTPFSPRFSDRYRSEDGGLAQAAGLAAGDLLASINGQRVTNARWDKVLGSLHEGQSMSICFYRDDLMHERLAFLEDSQMPAQYELSPTSKSISI